MKNSKNNVTPTRTPPLFPVVKNKKTLKQKNKSNDFIITLPCLLEKKNKHYYLYPSIGIS